MRWPRRRKPKPPDDDHDFLRAIGWIDDQDDLDRLRDGGDDA